MHLARHSRNQKGHSSNHGFADGNKRTALGAALVFLDANGYELSLTKNDLEQVTLDVAEGKLNKDNLTKLLEAAIKPCK